MAQTYKKKLVGNKEYMPDIADFYVSGSLLAELPLLFSTI